MLAGHAARRQKPRTIALNLLYIYVGVAQAAPAHIARKVSCSGVLPVNFRLPVFIVRAAPQAMSAP